MDTHCTTAPPRSMMYVYLSQNTTSKPISCIIFKCPEHAMSKQISPKNWYGILCHICLRAVLWQINVINSPPTTKPVRILTLNNQTHVWFPASEQNLSQTNDWLFHRSLTFQTIALSFDCYFVRGNPVYVYTLRNSSRKNLTILPSQYHGHWYLEVCISLQTFRFFI